MSVDRNELYDNQLSTRTWRKHHSDKCCIFFVNFVLGKSKIIRSCIIADVAACELYALYGVPLLLNSYSASHDN